MIDIRLEMNISNVDRVAIPGDGIRVRVEYDDGMVSYAEIDGIDVRCWVSTGDNTARWEQAQYEGAVDPWRRVSLDAARALLDGREDLLDAMPRAANAGLVAVGATRSR